MEPFALVDAVQRRLDFELDDKEQEAVSAALEDLSDEARFHAKREWPDPNLAPNMVRQTVIKAVKRWADNMHGYTVSRAADETLMWPNQGEEAGSPCFTAGEIKILKALGDGRVGAYFGVAEMVAYGSLLQVYDDGLVPTTGGGEPFPFNLPNDLVWGN